jgi:flagellar hook-length control protein FliK
MNNLPNIISTPQNAAKPALYATVPEPQIAKSATMPQPANKAENGSSEGKSFGEVLARQVSDAASVEDNSQPDNTSTIKAVKSSRAAKPADEVAFPAPAMENALTVQSFDTAPADEAAKLKMSNSKTADEIFSGIKSKMDDVKKTPSPNDGIANLPPGVLAGFVPIALANATSADTATSSKKAAVPGSGQNNILELNPDQVAGKKELSASKNSNQLNSSLPAAAKKDANFANMMETITASTTAKLLGNDDKAAALAAAPQANANVQATLQAASAPVALANAMPTQVTINTPVAHEKWGDEFNQKITWLSNQKEQTAELHLNPPQLGPMDVVLKVSGDQATALFTSPHAAVREAVEQALPRLREMLAESGIMLGNATVSDQAPRGRQGENDNKSGSRTRVGEITEASRAVNQNVRVSPISRHNGIVDTFA